MAALVRETARDGGDGLLQRVQLAVFPDDPGPWRKIDRWPDTAARDRAFAIFKALANMDPDAAGAETDPFDGTRYLRFDPAAQEMFYEWRAGLSARARSHDGGPMETHLAKYPSLMPSLALLFHLCDVADGATPGPVSADAARLAVQWCAYLESHAARVYAIGGAADMGAAWALADKIDAGKLASPFKRRDVQRRCWSGLSDRDSVGRAVAAIESLGWVRVVETIDTGGRPGKDAGIRSSNLRAVA